MWNDYCTVKILERYCCKAKKKSGFAGASDALSASKEEHEKKLYINAFLVHGLRDSKI